MFGVCADAGVCAAEEEADPEVVPAESEPAPALPAAGAEEVSEEAASTAQEAKTKALDAQADGKLADALELFTRAVTANPRSALLYASRAACLLQMKRPAAAVHDCDAALKLNPDSA